MKKSFFMITLATFLLTVSSLATENSTNYDKIKMMYGQAIAPTSISNFMDRVTRQRHCAEFTSLNPNQKISQSLVLVSQTMTGAGPEFPDQVLRGLGFLGADLDSEKFFENYVSHLDSSALSIHYKYQHLESICYDYPDGSSFCRGIDSVTISASAQFRVFKDYLIYKKAPDSYGYCWSN